MKVYIVEGSEGDYSDHTHWVDGVFLSQEGAQAHVDEIERRYAEVTRLYMANPAPEWDIKSYAETYNAWRKGGGKDLWQLRNEMNATASPGALSIIEYDVKD